MYQNNRYEFEIGDLVAIYSPLSQDHEHLALIVGGPNVYGVYTVMVQQTMSKRNFAVGEMERIN